MSVKIKGTFKKADGVNNGLNAIEDELRERPYEQRHVVGVLLTARYGEDCEKNELTTTVKFLNLEAAVDPDDVATFKDMLDRLFTGRTGGQTQPSLFDSGNVDGLDPTAGPWPDDTSSDNRGS